MSLEQLKRFTTKYHTGDHLILDALTGMRNKHIRSTTITVLMELCKEMSRLDLKRKSVEGKVRKLDFVEIEGDTVRIIKKRKHKLG